MEVRIGKKSRILIVTLLFTAFQAGCGGGGGSGSTSNPNTVAFTSALMDGGAYYVRAYSSYTAGKVAASSLPTVIGTEYLFNGAAWAATVQAGYSLNNIGVWQAESDPSSMVDNGDGSYTVDGVAKLSIVSVTDLAGQSPACINSSGDPATCPVNRTYATGAKQYSATATLLMDYYSLNVQMPAYTGLNGVSMTTLPVSGGAGYCMHLEVGSQADLYTLNGSTYDLRHPASCALTDITNVQASVPSKTGITITPGGRNGVTVALINFPAGSLPAYSYVIGEHGGHYWLGSFDQAAGGTPSPNTYYNRTAFDTLTAAHGLPNLP